MKVFLKWCENPVKRILGFLVGVSVMLLLSVTIGVGQAVIKLEDRRVSVSMKDQAFGTVINYLTNKYDISFGVELAPGNDQTLNFQIPRYRESWETFRGTRPTTTFTLDLKDAKVSDVMDAIVSQMDGYSWEIADGVVDIFPTKGRDERLCKLMEIDIDSFAMSKENDRIVGRIAQRVVALPEVNKFEKANNLKVRYHHYGDIQPGLRPLDDDIRLSKISFRQLLNKAAAAKKGNWRIILTNAGDQSGRDVIITLDI